MTVVAQKNAFHLGKGKKKEKKSPTFVLQEHTNERKPTLVLALMCVGKVLLCLWPKNL